MAAGLVAGDSGSLWLLLDLSDIGDVAKTDERGGFTLPVLILLICNVCTCRIGEYYHKHSDERRVEEDEEHHVAEKRVGTD